MEISGLKRANILYTTYFQHLQEPTHDRFDTVQELKQYFEAYKRRGECVGYVLVKNRTPGYNDHLATGKLSIEWNDAEGFHTVEFDHVDKMVEFMNQHVTIGLKLGYERKRRR
jgi:hypothetical protein